MTRRFIRIAGVVVALLILLGISSSSIVELLWMQEVGYTGVFWRTALAKITLGVASFALAAAYLVLNFRYLADRLRWAPIVGTPLQNLQLSGSLGDYHRPIKLALTIAALVLALFFALNFGAQWDASLRFAWRTEFGASDPIFGRDVGFYLFQLPFWELIQTTLTVLAFLTTALLALVYSVTGLLRYEVRSGIMAPAPVINQLRLNAVVWLVLFAWGLFLDRYQLLFRSRGVVFGATYTDLAIELPAIWIMLVLTLALAALLGASRWLRAGRWTRLTGLALLAVWILGRAIVPALVDRFQVNPNELEVQQPYIEHNIALTRLAYGLDDVQEVEYEADDTLSLADVQANQDAIDNIRLWDPRLIIQTYRQLQEIRTYYQFQSVDNDRYTINGQPRQMMLSAREIASSLPERSDTWLNRHLQFTHGYGLVMSPVIETNRQGEPVLVIRDIPPVVASPELRIDNPAIYYGEAGQGYYIVNTESPELHYPAGDENVYTAYEGSGGILLNSWFRKLLFAWELADVNILLSDYIRPDSRIQIWRGIRDRIRRITPFLGLDADPYLVIQDGRLFWIQDAYTMSRGFPYAQPVGTLNYIRNSVKVVVDAYEGKVDYYVVDERDPVLRVYDAIYPNLFKPLEALPDGLQEHFRYPEDLFKIQLDVFNRYHMTSPQVFYNDEDLWTRPNEKYGGQQLIMEPYYVLARLPGEDHLKFMLISPLTPSNRDNMISWMSAKSDPGEYGELVVYKLPKQRLIYGPAQVEARIDQDPEIARQLALWDQRGSRVIRGNLMVIPIGDAFLYVEPVFLLAEGVDIPQLQRVIVAIGDAVSMQPTIQEAIVDLFGSEAADLLPEPRAPVIRAGTESAAPDTLAPQVTAMQERQLRELEEARSIWQQLSQALAAGDWSRYGEAMNRLERLLGEE